MFGEHAVFILNSVYLCEIASWGEFKSCFFLFYLTVLSVSKFVYGMKL